MGNATIYAYDAQQSPDSDHETPRASDRVYTYDAVSNRLSRDVRDRPQCPPSPMTLASTDHGTTPWRDDHVWL